MSSLNISSNPNAVIGTSVSATDKSMETLLNVAIGLEAFSMFCSLTIPVIFIIAWKYSNELTKRYQKNSNSLIIQKHRVSFQLTVTLALVEALYAGAQIFSNVYVTEGFLCQFGIFLYVFFALLTIVLSMCIAINLQLVFVYNKRYENAFSWYILCSIIGCLCLSLPPLFFNAYGFDETSNSCWYTRQYDTKIGNLYISPFKWTMFYIPALVFISYSTFASISVMVKLARAQKESMSSLSDSNSKQQQKAKKIITKLVSRLMFYPLIPLFAQFFNIYGEADYAISHENKFSLLVASFVGTSIMGTLTTTLFFLIDPSWMKLKADMYKRWFPTKVQDAGSSTKESDSKSAMQSGTLRFSPYNSHNEDENRHKNVAKFV
ncbi:hypothetical protein HDU92_005828 [Lobulomyces angularis]|nr:hypothetical protein HDU92_005828 [Lobulomyces angularis]